MGSWKDPKSGLGAGPSGLSNYDLMSGLKQRLGKSAGELIGNFGMKARSQNSVVMLSQGNGPSVWGNVKGYEGVKDELRKLSQPYGSAENQVYANNTNWFVFSVNQQIHFNQLKVDMTLVTLP